MAVRNKTAGAVHDKQHTLHAVVLARPLDLLEQPLGVGRHDGAIDLQQRDLVRSGLVSGMKVFIRRLGTGEVLAVRAIQTEVAHHREGQRGEQSPHEPAPPKTGNRLEDDRLNWR